MGKAAGREGSGPHLEDSVHVACVAQVGQPTLHALTELVLGKRVGIGAHDRAVRREVGHARRDGGCDWGVRKGSGTLA